MQLLGLKDVEVCEKEVASDDWSLSRSIPVAVPPPTAVITPAARSRQTEERDETGRDEPPS